MEFAEFFRKSVEDDYSGRSESGIRRFTPNCRFFIFQEIDPMILISPHLTEDTIHHGQHNSYRSPMACLPNQRTLGVSG